MLEHKNKSSTLKSTRLSAEEVCKIIEACSRAQVGELKFAGLHLSFDPPVEQDALEWELQDSSVRKVSETPDPKISDTEISDATVESHAVDTMERDELRVKEQQIDELPLTSPLDYERGLASGDLEDAQFEEA